MYLRFAIAVYICLGPCESVDHTLAWSAGRTLGWTQSALFLKFLATTTMDTPTRAQVSELYDGAPDSAVNPDEISVEDE